MGDSVKDGVVAVTGFIATSLNNLSVQLNRLSAQQAVLFAMGVVVAVVLFLQLSISFYEAYMPSMLWSFIKFLVYLVIPGVAAAALAFGTWIERKYVVYDDAYNFIAKRAPPSFGLEEIHYD